MIPLVPLMIETLETSGPSSPRNSPVIVLTNSDYKRPSSILNSRSRGSTPCSTVYLPVYWWGVLMLSCHFFIGTVTMKIIKPFYWFDL